VKSVPENATSPKITLHFCNHAGCNLPHAFAAGDVAVTHDPVTGEPVMTALWTNAVEMGRCAGLNMAGIKTAYTGTFGILNATQVAGMAFVSMGMVLIGNITNAGIYRHVIQEKMDVTPFKGQIINHTLHWGHMAFG